MTKTRHLLASAPLAIAAMAALPATAFAQDAAPIVLDVPTTTTTAPAPKPVIVLPDPVVTAAPAPKVVAPGPTVTSEPVPRATAEPAPPAATRSAAPKARPTAAAKVSVAPVAAQASAPVAQTSEPLPAVLPNTSTTSADIATADTAAPQAELPPAPAPINDNSSIALLIALLAMGGIGLIAFLLIGAMRRRTRTLPVVEREAVSRPVAPAPVVDREPVVSAYDAAPLAAAPMVEPTVPVLAASSDAAVELPAEAPRSERERGRLIQRMVAARPDRANPFHSHKARAKRARLILQSIGTRFTDRKPGIDLSQYTNIWPELRGWRPATA